MRGATIGASIALWIGACAISPAPPETDPRFRGKTDGFDLGELPLEMLELELELDADGNSAVQAIEVPAGTVSMLLVVSGEARTTYVVDSLEGPSGDVWISRDPGVPIEEGHRRLTPFPGPLLSANRSSQGVGFTSLLVPNSPAVAFEAGEWRFRVAGRDVGADAPASGTISVRVVFKSAASESDGGRLALHLHFTGSHGWSSETAREDEDFRAMLDTVQSLYAQVGIDVVVASQADIDPGFQTVSFANRDFYEVIRSGPRDIGINVYFIDRFDLGAPGASLAGWSRGTPGPMLAESNAVVVATDRSVDDIARIVAHETAHTLSLFHVVELGFDVSDPISDTDEDGASTNLMSPVAAESPAATELTEGQGFVLHRSPYVLPAIPEP